MPRTTTATTRSPAAPAPDPGPPPEPAPAARDDGRDEGGRFTKGNKGGPGNPFARQVAALRKQLVEAVTPEVMAQICQVLLLRAQGGHLAAIKLLFTYVLGAPGKAVDPDTLDLQEMEQYRKELGMEELAVKVNHALTPEIACATVRAVRPVVMGDLCNALADQLMEGVPPEFLPPDRQPSPNGENGESRHTEEPAAAPEEDAEPPSPNGGNGPAPGGGRRQGPECRRETGRANPAPTGPRRAPPVPARRPADPLRDPGRTPVSDPGGGGSSGGRSAGRGGGSCASDAPPGAGAGRRHG